MASPRRSHGEGSSRSRRRPRRSTAAAPQQPRVRSTPVRRPEHVWSIRESLFRDLDEEFRRTAPSTVRPPARPGAD